MHYRLPFSRIYDQKCFSTDLIIAKWRQFFSRQLWRNLNSQAGLYRTDFRSCPWTNISNSLHLFSHLPSLESKKDTKQDKYLTVFRIYRFYFSSCSKLRSLKTILPLLNDTKQYVCRRPPVSCSYGSFEHSTARRKVDIILFLCVFVQRA